MKQTKKLKDIAIISAGQSAPQGKNNYSSEGIPFVKAGNLVELIDGAAESSIQKVSEMVAKEHKLKLYQPGTVLFAKSGMSCMKGYVYQLKSPCYVVSHLACITVTEISGEYLKYYFEYHRPNSLVKDEAYPSISLVDIGDMEISYGNRQEQKEAVIFLNAIQKIIKQRREEIKKLDDLVKSQFIEMFGDVVYNNKRWVVFPMSTVAPIKAFKGEVEAVDGKVWLLNLDMIEAHTGDVQEEVLVGIDDIGASTVAFNRDNILYSKLRPYLNKVVYPKKTGYATSELVPLRPDINLLNKVFFTALLRSDAFVHFIREQVAGAKMPRVSMDIFKKFDVICPPIELQNQFAHFVEQTDKSKVLIREHLFLINRFRKVEKT